MPDRATVLSELRAIASSDATAIGENTFRRLMLAAMQETLDMVTTMNHKIEGNGKPGLEARLTRLEWLAGVMVAVLGTLGTALIGALVTGRLQIIVSP